MSWPLTNQLPQVWTPPVEGKAILLAVPVPSGLTLMEEETYRSLLAIRIQWMLKESDLNLSEFHRLVADKAGEVQSADPEARLEDAGERMMMESELIDQLMSQLPTFPMRVANLDPEDVVLVEEVNLEEWLAELGSWAGL